MPAPVICNDCKMKYQGFHLCIGPNAPKELRVRDAVWRPTERDMNQASNNKKAAAQERWRIHWDQNAERDNNIKQMYEYGHSLQVVADSYEVSKMTVKSIVLRLGGSMRPRNQGRPR